jgi:hypothetical protein
MTAKHVPTDETRKRVKDSSAVGLPQDLICAQIGIRSEKTLRSKYRKEIAEGRATAGFNVAKTAYDRALAGDPGMIRWWTATQLKWAPATDPVQIYTPAGKGIVVSDAREDTLTQFWRREEERKAVALGAAVSASPRALASDGPGDAESAGSEEPGAG